MIEEQELNRVINEILEHTSSTNLENEEQYELHPKQLEFLKKLQSFQTQDDYSAMEQLCISHCIKYGHYSEMHKEPLNKLIKKYSKKV